MTKKCSKCKKEKLLVEFSRNQSKKDGHQDECKQCRSNYNRAWTKTRVGKEAYRKATERYRRKNKLKCAAQNALNYAVETGKLERLPCRECGSTYKTNGHHENYNYPLNVIWLCAKHHKELHREEEDGDINRN